MGMLLCRMYSGLAADDLAKISSAVSFVFGFWQVLKQSINLRSENRK